MNLFFEMIEYRYWLETAFYHCFGVDNNPILFLSKIVFLSHFRVSTAYLYDINRYGSKAQFCHCFDEKKISSRKFCHNFEEQQITFEPGLIFEKVTKMHFLIV